jgi:hypothetical protein
VLRSLCEGGYMGMGRKANGFLAVLIRGIAIFSNELTRNHWSKNMTVEPNIRVIVGEFSRVEGFEKVRIVDTWPAENYYRVQIKVKTLKSDYIKPYYGAAPLYCYPTKLSFTKVKFEKEIGKRLSAFKTLIKDYSFLDWPTRKSGYADRSYGEKTPSYFDQDTYEIEFYLND